MSSARLGRAALWRAKRVIVKIGSQAIAEWPGLLDEVAGDVAELRRQGRSVVIVSSGAVALGWKRLGYRRRPRDVARLQASAAAGQSILMHRYGEALRRFEVVVAQVLLTQLDLARRSTLNNARNALGALLDAGSVPIVNENDTVATEQIRFGDNDQLAAMITPLLDADLLVMLTGTDGVLDARGKRMPVFARGDHVVDRDASAASDGRTPAASTHGSGGIVSKVEAARKACRSGAHVVVAPATARGVLRRVVAGEDLGTLFEPLGSPLRARKHWIAYALRPRGTLLLDQGAVRAVLGGRKSLLPIGVAGVRGQFNPGDSVRLVGPDGSEVARGLSRLSALAASRAAGACRDATGDLSREDLTSVVVHKDDLVLLD